MTTQLRPLPRHQRRHRLAVTSALLVVWSLSGNALAGNPLPTTPNPTVGAPTITDDGTNMTVDLNNASTVIEWNSFDIGSVNTVTYNGAGKAVLNRVTGATASDINGTLNASGVQFWLLNPNGILVNNGASINTGSFFASTLTMGDTDFTNSGGFTLSGAASTGITVQNGATITTSGGPLVLAGQDITVGGTLAANSGGDLALVAATDLTIAAAPFSPLSITVNAGTKVASAKVQVDGTGQLTGQSIIVAGKVDSSSPALIDDLLNVDSGATLTATTAGGRIILSAGGINAASGSAAGITGLTGGNSAGVDSAGTLAAASDVLIGATGNLTQAGDVTAGGDYTVTAGESVFLAGTQAAAGQVAIQGIDVTATGTLSLTSNSTDAHAAGSPAGAMSVASSTGDIDLGSTSTLKGGIANHTDVTLTSGAGTNVTVGTVTTRSLGGLSGQTGNVTVGNVTVDTALDIETTGGNVTTKGLTVGGTGQNATIGASGTATIDGAVSVTGDYAVTGNDVALGGAQGAHGKVTVQATGGDITATATALTLTSNKDDAQAAGNAAGAMALTAASGKVDLGTTSTLKGGGTSRLSDITVTTGAGKTVVVGTVAARSLAGLAAQSGDITTGGVTVDRSLDLKTTAGTITTGAVTVGGSNQTLGVDASGDVKSGVVSVSGDAVVKGANIRVASVTSSTGNVDVEAATDLTGQALVVTPTSLADYGRANLTASAAGKTVTAKATAGTAKLGTVTAGDGTTSAVTTQVDIEGEAVDVTSAEAKDAKLYINTTTGDAVVGTATAKADVQILSAADIRLTSATSSTGNVDVEAASDLTGQALVATPASLADYGRADLTASAAGKTVTAKATAGTAKLGTVTAGDGTTSAVTTQVDIEGEAVDVTSAEAKDAKLYINTTTGDAVVGTATAKADVQILSAANIRLTSATSSTGMVDVEAATDLTGQALVATPASLADYGRADLTASAAGKTVTAKATAGTAKLGTVTAGDGTASGATTQVDIEGEAVDVTSAEAKDAKLYINTTTGNAVVGTATAKADVQILSAANIRLTSATSSTGMVDVEAATDLTGQALVATPASLADYGRANLTASAAGKTVTAKATAGTAKLGAVTAGDGTTSAATTQVDIEGEAVDVTSAEAKDAKLYINTTTGDAVVGTATAKADVQILSAGNIRLTSATSSAGNVDVEAATDLTGLALVATPASLADYGRANLTASAAGKTVTAKATAGTAKLGTVTAGDGTASGAATQVDIEGEAVDVTSAEAKDRKLYIQATGHDVVVDTAKAKSDIQVLAAANIRVGTATSTAGSLQFTANTGDISGLAITSASDFRLLSGYGRAGLTASAQGQTITVTATQGNIQAGAVTAGTGTASPPAATNEITLTAGRAIDVTAANARDGKLTATSQDGNLVLVTAAGAGGVSLEADKGATATTASIRADTVSSTKGDITLTADNGGITATAATPGGTNYQRMDITASGAGKAITASAIHGTVLFDAVTAGDGTTTLAGNQVDISAHDIVISDVTAKDGGIVLSTAVAGGGNDITVGTGHAKTWVRLASDHDAGATALTADAGDATVTAAHAATISNDVSAATNYLVTGQSVTLGNTATPTTQTAGGLVRIVSTAGGVSGRGVLVLKSDSDNSGGEPILLEATGGTIDFATGSTLQGGGNRTGKIGIYLGTAGSDLSLGTVNARGLYGIDATETFLGNLTTSGDVTLGATSLRNALTLETTGGDVHTGTIITSGDGQGLSLKASGDIVAGGILSSQGNLRLEATNVGITTAQSHNGTATLIASATASGTSLKALGSVSETANSDQITTTVGGAAATASADSPTDPGTHANSGTGAGGTSYGTGYDDGTPSTGVAPDPTLSDVIITGAVINKATVTAQRDIIVTAGNSGTATNGSATVTTATAGRDATITAWAGAGATTPADGNVTVATVKAGRDLTLTTTGGAVGDVTVTTTAQGSYNNTVTGDVQIHAAGDVQAADIKALKGSIDVAAGDSAGSTNGAATVTSATASNDIMIAAWAGAGASLPSNGSITVDTARAGGNLALTTTGAAKGGIAVTTIAQGSFGGTLTGDVTVDSAGDVRAKEITAAKGNIAITAVDDISGTKAVATPASITDYNRAVVTASGQDKTVRIESTNGQVRLGAVAAGSGTTTLSPGTQVWIQGAGVDADNVAATNGSVFLNAFGPASELVVTSVTARTNGDLDAANSVRVGTVTATDGYISVVATNGDVSGLKRTAAATDGRLLAGYDRSTLTAGGNITLHADGTSGNLQTGTMTAGGDVTGSGQAIDADYGYANGGDLALTSATGDVRLIQGHARDSATVQAAANARIGGLDATNGDAAITATTGAATGLAGAGEASNLDAAYGRTVVTAGHDIQVTAHDLVQLGNLTAGNDITVAAMVNTAQVDGAVQANGAYDVSGTSVVLGHAAATQAQSAKGLVRLTATAGDITSRGAITLTANSDDTAATAEPMYLKATGGNIDFNSATLKGGTSRTSNIGVYLGTVGADLSLGIVQARGLYGLNPAETLLADLTTSGDIRLGATSVRNTLDLVTTGGAIVTTGNVSVTGAGQGLSFDTYGAAGHDITAGGVLSAQGYLNLASARDISLTTAISNAGAISVVAGGNASGTLLKAYRGVFENVGGDDTVSTTLGQQSATTAPDSDAFAISLGGVTGDPVSAPPGGNGAGGGVGPGPVFDDVYISAGTVTKAAVSGGHDVTIIATTGDVKIATATAGNDLSVQSNAANVRLDTGIATSGKATITAALAATGRTGASDGKDAAFKRTDLAAGSAVAVTSGTLSQLGTVVADSGAITVTAGNSATPRNGAIDIASADGGTTLSLKTWSNSNAAAAGNGDILVGTATADGGATLDSSTGTYGDIVITNGLTASNSAIGDAILKAAGSVRFDAVTAKAGSVAVTAGGDVSGLKRTAAATDGRLLAGYDRGNVTAGGDGRTVSITAADGKVQLATVKAGATGTSVTTDQLSVTARAVDVTSVTAYNGKLNLNATAGDIVLHDGAAEGGTTAAASANIRAGSVTSKSGNIILTATAGDATGLATTTTPTTLADYGRSDLIALANGKTVTVTASNGNAKLGTIAAGDGTTAMAGDQVTVSAKGVDVTSAMAKDGGLNLAATAGNVVLHDGTAQGSATAKASANVRVATVTSKGGNIILTATAGDATGLATTTTPTTLADYGRSNLTAQANGKTVTVTASNGSAKLGTIVAGDGTTAMTGDQVTVSAKGIDITSATAKDGGLNLAATSGDVVLRDGTAQGSATATASANVRAGSVTSKNGNIALTATAGDATGLATTATPSSLADYGRADLTAQANGKTITVTTSNGNAKLGTIAAGDGTTAMAGDQVTVSAKGVDITSAMAKDGGLNLAATAGNVVLHDGMAGGDATAAASANIRVGSVTSKSGNLTLTATAGDATGLATTATPTSLADYGRADLTAQKNGKTVKVTASNGSAKLGTVSAGDGTTATTGDQVAVSAKAVDITSVAAKDGDLTLTATATDVALGTGKARGKATVTALRSVTGSLIQSTDKAIAVEATNGDIVLTTGTAGTSATLKAGGNARLGTVASTAGGTSVTAVGDISGLARTAAATDGRLLTGFDRADISASGDGQSITLTGKSVQVGTVTAGTTTTATSGTQIGITAGAIDATTATANNGALDLMASTGNIKLGTGTATGNATLKTTGAGADIAVTTALTGASVAVTSADDANLAAVTSKVGDISVSGATIEVVSVSAKTALSLVSTGNLSLGGGSAGTTALLKTTGTGDVALTGSLISNDKATVASVSNATLGDITAKGADITAAKTARLAAVTATGQDVSLHALDADLTGDIKASTITVTTDQGLTLGDLGGGFNLSSTELNHLKASGGANTVTLSAGSFGIAIGNVDWSLPDAATTANLFTTGRVDITGRFALDPSASGSTSTTSRTLVIGGTTTGGSMASVIRVAATAGGGGRIDVGAGTVDLRGASIGVGEDEAFLASLGLTGTGTPVSADTVATAYVAQPESSLYRARSLYTNPVLIRAGTVKVAYSNFALFQNTGVIGLNSGVQAVGGLPAIVLTGTGSANAFALFGDINGIGGQAAALLGPTVIAVTGAVPGNSRINGCVIGAATACLASSLTQPPLNVFDSSKVAVLSTVSPDLSFDTGISSSNESLFSDIAAPATQQDTCDPTVANCPTKETQQ